MNWLSFVRQAWHYYVNYPPSHEAMFAQDIFQAIASYCNSKSLQRLLSTCKSILRHASHLRIKKRMHIEDVRKFHACYTYIIFSDHPTPQSLARLLHLSHLVLSIDSYDKRRIMSKWPSTLKYLELIYWPNMKKKNITSHLYSTIKSCSSPLKTLKIVCDAKIFFDDNILPQQLQKLYAARCVFSHLPHTLKFLSCKCMRDMNANILYALHQLRILKINNDVNLNFTRFKQLERLTIYACYNNVHLPDTVYYFKCHQLFNNDHLFRAHDLKTLQVKNCDVKVLPHQLQRLECRILCVVNPPSSLIELDCFRLNLDLCACYEHIHTLRVQCAIGFDIKYFPNLRVLHVDKTSWFWSLNTSRIHTLYVTEYDSYIILPATLRFLHISHWSNGNISLPFKLQTVSIDRREAF